nr:cAMP-regulated D2 protein-like [Ciona intestinalis]|eukprot:XP_002127916.1 cAMP-regulated D2 protein-like [Ciona intestinalis]
METKLFLLFTLCLFGAAVAGPTVKTNNGHLFGVSEAEASVFYSIPYAKPPVGNLRFQNPVPIGYLGDIDVTNNTGVGCIGMRLMCSIGQCAEFESEDCLYLNVYVPTSVDLSDPANQPKATLPVLVWFHGGAFWFGAGLAPLYDGRFLAEKTGAIVVTLNYRYMPFGFLAMGSSAPGNMGFRDQQVALQWVQDNIGVFGGSNSQVTIYGESAGAQTIGLHLLSSVSKPLFTNAFMQSNPVSFTFKTSAEAVDLGTRLSKRTGCLTGSYNCLVQKSSEEIKSAFVKVMMGNMASGDFYGFIEPFAPVIDGVEFTQQQADAFAAGEWHTDKNVVIGTDFQELYLVSAMIPVALSYDRFVSMCEKMWPGISDDVIALYAPDPTVTDFRDAYGDMLTHYAFTCSSRSVARSAAATKDYFSNVFYFTNYHPLTGPDCPTLLGPLKRLCGYAYHSSELSYVWRTGPNVGQTYTEDEVPYVNAWTNYIGNFVFSGNVNKGLDAGLQSDLGSFVEWPQYQAPVAGSATGSSDWLSASLDAPYPSVEQEPLDHYCSYWDTIGYDFKIFGPGFAEALNIALNQE